ncbi:HEAT repeat domain-containing protein [Kitasatospora sp. NPDC101447]|uniref:HEAT repeat domain-containing protein n=1 Tax=Kitasatospora sp. NPDC101447 TaxID=3364102 RepID=UPI003822499C
MSVVDEVWERLEQQPGSAGLIAMLQGIAASEPADGYRLAHAMYSDRRGMSALAPDALPIVLALARDSALPARDEVVLALNMLVECARSQPAGRIPPAWLPAWQVCRAAAEPLVADQDPKVRWWAVDLVERPGPLSNRLRTEIEPSMRIRLLLRLGQVATPTDDQARAALAAVAGSPVLRLAALRGLNRLDPDGAAGRVDGLVDLFTDPSMPASVELLWNPADEDYRPELSDLVLPTAEDLPAAVAARFTARLARCGEPELRVSALDAAWQVLVLRPSAGPELLTMAGALLDDPDPRVRVRAAHLLAMLGKAAAPFADRLFALLDDLNGDEWLDGTIADFACWALARIGDPRALPGLVWRLTAVHREQGRSWTGGDPHRPDPYDALIALPEHAEALRPQMAEWKKGGLLSAADVLAAWDGRDAIPCEPPAGAGLDSVACRLREMRQQYRPWHETSRYRTAMVAVATLSQRGPLRPKVRAAVEHALSLDRRLSKEYYDYRAVLDDERVRDMLQRALRGEAVRMPALSIPLPG